MTQDTFDWSAYLELAKELGSVQREESGRSAISRAYYAAFHHAKSYVERTTSVQMHRDGSAHSRVPEELRRMRPPRSKLANKLDELKRLRTWADYDASHKRSLAEAVEKALTHARLIISELT